MFCKPKQKNKNEALKGKEWRERDEYIAGFLHLSSKISDFAEWNSDVFVFFVDSYCNMCGIYLGAGPWLEMTVEYAKEKEKQLDLFKFLKDTLFTSEELLQFSGESQVFKP